MAIVKLTLLVFAVLGSARALLAKDGPSPVAKVLDLLSSMRDDIMDEFVGEEEAYSKFSCFCKKTTLERSSSIETHTKKIHVISANIGVAVRKKDNLMELVQQLKSKLEAEKQELAQSEARCEKEETQKKAEVTDIGNALKGLQNALGAIDHAHHEYTRRTQSTSFLSIRANLTKTLMLAEVLSKPSATRRKAIALLQKGNPEETMTDGFHDGSDEIMTLMEKLEGEYQAKLDELTQELDTHISFCRDTKRQMEDRIDMFEVEINGNKHETADTQVEIAEHRSSLLTRDKDLKDDELYLKDLTLLCEERAKDWDQRSQAHRFEVENIEKALTILSRDVKTRESDRAGALLQKAKRARNLHSAEMLSDTASKVQMQIPGATIASKSLSFLQASEDSSSEVRSHKFLGRGQLSLELRRDRALSTLRNAGQKLGSLALSTLALRAAGDPFKKVKGLIQNLIERLLEESKGEASKKGFCDTELAKAKKDRDFRWEESQDLSADLAKLEAKEESLTNDIKELTKGIKTEQDALKETTADRELETNANTKTIATAEEGRKAVSQAIVILREAYKQLAKGDSLLQEEASPVNENEVGPGFSGTYHGAQGRTKAVFSLLEDIYNDFDRTVRTIEAAEKAAHRDFVDFTESAESSIAAKEKQQSLDRQDLKTTKVGIATKTSDMKTAVGLMDSALKELEELKPTCIDTGMSFEERVKKRESEMAALQHALCLLDADAEADGSSCSELEGAMNDALE